MDPREALRHAEIFRNVEPCRVNGLLATVAHFYRTYQQGEVVVRAGEPYHTLLVGLSGEIVAQMGCAEGRCFTPWRFGPRETILPGLLFANTPMPVTLVAREETHVVCLPRGSVLQLCRENREFLLTFLSDTGERFCALAHTLWMLCFASLQQRTAAYLLQLSEQQESDCVELPCTKTALAEILMAERPSLSRVLSDLTSKRVIKVEGRTVHLLARRDLEEMLAR
jgi:CRP-like cAMP-binding protein